MDEQLEHIEREHLPWRDQVLTECGLDTDRPTLSREAFTAKVRAQGQQRAAMSTCMTCWSAARQNKTWADSPADVVGREWSRQRWSDQQSRLDRELLAAAALIEAHREEFEGFLAGLEQTTDLSSYRKEKKQHRRL